MKKVQYCLLMLVSTKGKFPLCDMSGLRGAYLLTNIIGDLSYSFSLQQEVLPLLRNYNSTSGHMPTFALDPTLAPPSSMR